MATYTAAELISPKNLGSGSANIATFQKQNTAGAGTFDIYRSIYVCNTSLSGKNFTGQEGTSGATDTTQLIFLGINLDFGVLTPFNFFIAVPNNSYFALYANTTLVTGAAYGFTYA